MDFEKKLLIIIAGVLSVVLVIFGLSQVSKNQKKEFGFENSQTRQTVVDKAVDFAKKRLGNEYQQTQVEDKDTQGFQGGEQVVQTDPGQTRAIFSRIDDNKIYLKGFGGKEFTEIELTDQTGYQCQKRYYELGGKTVDATKTFINFSKAEATDFENGYVGKNGLDKLKQVVDDDTVLTVTTIDNEDGSKFAKIIFIVMDNCRQFYESL